MALRAVTGRSSIFKQVLGQTARLRGSDASNLLETALTDFPVADDKLLHLAANGHGESVDESDMFGNFEVRYFALTEILNFLLRAGLPAFKRIQARTTSPHRALGSPTT